MERAEILNSLLGLCKQQRYLEIGVQHGLTLRAIKASRRVAVDPKMLFDCRTPGVMGEVNVDYHETTSDTYFARAAPNELFDVIFIDGLHTFDQTLRDLLNAVIHLAVGGFIVIDDVIPTTYPASLPSHAAMAAVAGAIGEASPAWMGDVYRLVFFVRHYLPAFSFATVSEGHGQSILWRQTRELPETELTVENISRLSYADSVMKREMFNIQPFAAILRLIDRR